MVNPEHFWYLLVSLLITISLVFCIALIFIYTKFKKLFKTLDTTINKAVNFTYSDPLTGLLNQALFFEQLKMKLLAAKQKHKSLALLFMDIDNFRKIKDSLGYSLGDSLLQETAKRLLIAMNYKKETLAHIGSDQFTLILEEIEDQKNIDEFAENLLGLLSEPFNVQGHDISMTTSIGISLYPDNGHESEVLLKCAGLARYHAKLRGGNTYCFYSQDMDTQQARQRTIETHLRKAILKGELIVCYQPKVDILTRRIIGAEALLRWESPELGVVSPGQFIPMAEQTGLIQSMGNWVLRKGCLQTQEWHLQGYPDLTIAINLSASQFKTGDIGAEIAEAIWDSGLDPRCLELELTESLMMENVEKALLTIHVLKNLGIQISIDDFGTGHSSLSQIKRFPVDSLKIDQSFIKNIEEKSEQIHDKAIITTIITMAKQLGIKVIAEGVETEKQLAFLKVEGCDIVQGYLFGPPLQARDFAKLLSENWGDYPKA